MFERRYASSSIAISPTAFIDPLKGKNPDNIVFNNQANTYTGGGTQAFSGNISVPTNTKVLFDGITGHTRIIEIQDNDLRFIVGNQSMFRIDKDTQLTEVVAGSLLTALNTVCGARVAIADNATDGFLYIPETDSGTPTGTPTAFTGKAAMCFDPANKTLFIFNTDASVWEGVVVS